MTVIRFFISSFIIISSSLFMHPVGKGLPSVELAPRSTKPPERSLGAVRGMCRPVQGGAKNSASGLGVRDCLPQSPHTGTSMSQIHHT